MIGDEIPPANVFLESADAGRCCHWNGLRNCKTFRSTFYSNHRMSDDHILEMAIAGAALEADQIGRGLGGSRIGCFFSRTFSESNYVLARFLARFCLGVWCVGFASGRPDLVAQNCFHSLAWQKR